MEQFKRFAEEIGVFVLVTIGILFICSLDSIIDWLFLVL